MNTPSSLFFAGSREGPVVSGVNAQTADQALLQAGLAGDRSALEQLLSRYENPLLALCRAMLGQAEDAEDAVQETFLRALRALPRFRGDASPKTWLFRIAVNVCLEWKRSRRAAQARDDVWHRRLAGPPCPEDEAMRRLLILEALQAVRPHQRAVLLLRADGWSVAEIAAVVRWPNARVYYEIRKAHRLLAEWQEAEGAER